MPLGRQLTLSPRLSSPQQGIFKQILSSKGDQVEVPDPWLENGTPFEVPRLDAAVEIKLYGEATRGENGKSAGSWTGGVNVLAVPFDIPVPGFRTTSTNNIRAWAARGAVSFDLAAFNAGDYDAAVREAEEAETITRVLYPSCVLSLPSLALIDSQSSS